jgi:transcriptional regulator with XRE-family HTH domain
MTQNTESSLYTSFMAGRPPKREATEFGKRLTALRKAAGLSQVEVALKLGIPQRTFSYYEREAQHLPSNLVQPLADLLGAQVFELLGVEAQMGSKRGPKSKLERLIEKAQQLPRSKQDFIVKLLGQILAAEGVS